MTLPIRDNRVIIIGHNGIGKSTILNAFYYLISAQWEKLGEIDFDSLEVRANNQTFTVKQEQLLEIDSHAQQSLFEPRTRREFSREISRVASNLTKQESRALSEARVPLSMMRFIAEREGVPVSLIEELSSILSRDRSRFREHLPSEVRNIRDFFEENLEGQILYLPTYRRIEKNIESIFPWMEEEVQRTISRSRRARGLRRQRDLYIELVNFGMNDIYRMIDAKMESLRYLPLNEIRELSTRYFRDVIRDDVNTSDLDRIRVINESDLERIFANVDESVLDRQDRIKIYEVFKKVKDSENIEKDIKGNERYVAYYISSLIDISDKIADREKPVQEFVRICGSYLFEKKIKFNNLNYSLQIEYDDKDPGKVELENLSSGEKQIVSLFAHMTLDDSPNKYVLIDEPELSLSVDWQEKLLDDISDLDSCAFIGAVTHSPFVFANKLDGYAVDMFSCIGR